jgi:transketolase
MSTASSPFVPGKAQVVWESTKPRVALVVCGPILYNALHAARLLEREGVGSVVVNAHTAKPLDEKKIIDVAKKCGAVVTVEEHQVMGGLGGAVAECLARAYPVPMAFVGMHDSFGSSGAPEKLMAKYGIDASGIADVARNLARRK